MRLFRSLYFPHVLLGASAHSKDIATQSLKGGEFFECRPVAPGGNQEIHDNNGSPTRQFGDDSIMNVGIVTPAFAGQASQSGKRRIWETRPTSCPLKKGKGALWKMRLFYTSFNVSPFQKSLY
jgi:hypothetical protein